MYSESARRPGAANSRQYQPWRLSWNGRAAKDEQRPSIQKRHIKTMTSKINSTHTKMISRLRGMNSMCDAPFCT